MVGNTAYVASRAKSRRKKLADLARMRQLINQSTDQLTASVSSMGYADEVNLYAGKLTGADLVEAALTHNLEAELLDILKMCNGKIRDIVEIYTSRFEYQNAKVVLRSVVNEVSMEKVSNSILPDLNEINTPWLKIIETADDLRSAALQMRRKPFGSDLKALPEDARLSEYEDALDRHYFKSALKSLKANNPATRYLKDYLAMEIDHRNMLNILESDSIGISSEETSKLLIPGGKILPSRSFSTIAAGGKSALTDILRTSARFDMAHFEMLLDEVFCVCVLLFEQFVDFFVDPFSCHAADCGLLAIPHTIDPWAKSFAHAEVFNHHSCCIGRHVQIVFGADVHLIEDQLLCGTTCEGDLDQIEQDLFGRAFRDIAVDRDHTFDIWMIGFDGHLLNGLWSESMCCDERVSGLVVGGFFSFVRALLFGAVRGCPHHLVDVFCFNLKGLAAVFFTRL